MPGRQANGNGETWRGGEARQGSEPHRTEAAKPREARRAKPRRGKGGRKVEAGGRNEAQRAPAVPARATQGAEARWSRGRSFGLDGTQVSALENGVKGGRWARWPDAFFAQAGLLALHTAWQTARCSR